MDLSNKREYQIVQAYYNMAFEKIIEMTKKFLNNNKRVYILKQNQILNQKKEDKNNKNIGITFISNIYNSHNKNITESSRKKNNYKSLKAEPRKSEIIK